MPNKTSLRVVSLGYEFRDARVANIKFKDPQTVLDRDIILFSPSGFYRAYRPDLLDRPTVEGDWCVGDDDSPRLVRDLRRRQNELKEALKLGKTLVVFVPPPERFFVGSGEDEWSGTGRNRARARGVRPDSVLSTLPFPLETETGASRDLQLQAGDPFASFWRKTRGSLAASAIIKDAPGTPLLTINGTSAVVASLAQFGKGLAVLLPGELAYNEDEDEDEELYIDDDQDWEEDPKDVWFLDSLLEFLRVLRQTEGDYELPEWASAYLLPGEADQSTYLQRAEAAAAEALREVDERRKSLEQLQQRKVLVAGTGAALEALVADALSALGLSVRDGRPGRTDRIAKYAGRPVVVEVKGLTKSAGEKDVAQLEKWVSEHLLEHDERPKAILVVNGWRNERLGDRTEPVFPHQMRALATARQHALVTGSQLLCAWLDVEAHPEKREAVAESLLSCEGVWDDYALWEEHIARRQQT